MEDFKESDLLRCTKHELIEYIFELREIIEWNQKNQGQLRDAIYALKNCPMIKDVWENCD